MRIRPVVLLPLRNHTAFLQHYFNQGALGGIFAPGYLTMASAQEVDLELVFATEQITMHSRGIVRWKRMSHQKDLPAGVGIEFLPSERRTRDLLLDLANGKSVSLKRRQSRRFPAALEIEYATGSVFVTDVTDDLSRVGAAILSDDPPDVGTQLQLRLAPPDTPPISLSGEVCWRQTEGRKSFGLRFIFADPEQEAHVRSLVETIKHRVAREAGKGSSA